jgi:hypothetical protein
MNRSKAEAMVTRLLANAAGLKFGSASVCLKIHEGRISQISFETTESNRETIKEKETEALGEVNKG